METVCLEAVNGPDGKVRLEVACHLPPGPVQVVVVLGPVPSESSGRSLYWRDLYGAAKDLGSKEDAQEFVNRLRDEWER
jgi:hypothetical protein